jgi:hypothetical protein
LLSKQPAITGLIIEKYKRTHRELVAFGQTNNSISQARILLNQISWCITK